MGQGCYLPGTNPLPQAGKGHYQASLPKTRKQILQAGHPRLGGMCARVYVCVCVLPLYTLEGLFFWPYLQQADVPGIEPKSQQ